MSEKDPQLHIDYILESIALVKEYVVPGKDYFISDIKTNDAVLRRLATLAESSALLPKEIKQAMPSIDWASIAGFRNVMVHAYLGSINYDRVWNVIQNRLPELQKALETYMKHKAG